MATETIFNPLIKKGFQEIADVSTIQAELADLQERLTAAQNAIVALKGNKITKITDPAQLSTIEENEIFEWQTDVQTLDGTSFKNGYFYKCTTNTITLPTGTQYFENGTDEVNLYGYDVRPGNFYIVEDNTPAASNDFFNLRVTSYDSSPDYLFVNYAFPTVGEAVWNRATNEVVTVQSVDENLSLHLSDGQTVTTTNSSSSHPYKLYKVLDENGNYFNVANCSPMGVWIFLPNYIVNGNNFTVNDWFSIRYYNLLTTLEPTEIGQNTYAQTNTQQQQLSVENSIVKYTLSDNTTVLNLAQLTNDIGSLLTGHLLGWNASTNLFETKTAYGGKYDSFDGTTFANKTITGCCVHASGNGYSFTYYTAKQSNDNQLTLYGMNNTNTSRDSVTLTDIVTSDNVWSGVGASLVFAYFTYI